MYNLLEFDVTNSIGCNEKSSKRFFFFLLSYLIAFGENNNLSTCMRGVDVCECECVWSGCMCARKCMCCVCVYWHAHVSNDDNNIASM